MQTPTKKLGEMLLEARLITAAQLQDALTHQRIAGGRMGSILVGLGFVSEDVLMDFLAVQTGVPRLDLRGLSVDPKVLQRIPKRMAEQFNILPVAYREPKTLVLAMADPSDLNAIDGARFASGLTIDPVLVFHTGIREAIQEQYRRGDSLPVHVEPQGDIPRDEALPMPFEIPVQPVDPRATGSFAPLPRLPRDPFFDDRPVPVPPSPLSFLAANGDADPTSSGPWYAAENPAVVHTRSEAAVRGRRLTSLPTRTLVLGLVKLLQRRGVLTEDDLTRFINNLLDNGELEDEGKKTGGSVTL